MSKERTPIPRKIAAQVMFESDRTCCVCRKEKLRIQIHHLDEDPTNHDPENLAVLCIFCHHDSHLKGGFSRKLDAEQIRLFNIDWIDIVRRRREKLCTSDHSEQNEEYVTYEVVQESIRTYSNDEVKKNALKFFLYALLFVFSFFLPVGLGLKYDL